MNKKLLLLVVIIFPITLISFLSKETVFFTLKEEQKIRVKITQTGVIKELLLNDYVIGVIAAEMPASFHEEALKAQAVVTRTYALNHITNSDYDVDDTVSNQAFIDKEQMKEKWLNNYKKYYDKIKKCVLKTNEEVITYNNKIINAFYFAMSNGYTENAQSVFFQDLPYIKSVESSWDNKNISNFFVSKEISINEFKQLLMVDNAVINNIVKSNTNHVEKITVDNKEFSGTEFRQKLKLRSTDFEIVIKDKVEITTKGYGHGVGMSQYGANGMAQEGYNYKDIIKHYYQDIEIKEISSIK